MLSSIHFLRNLDFWSVLLRMVLSCACGAAIGLERFYKNRPAGFRTHILVCMGSAVAADCTCTCRWSFLPTLPVSAAR